MHKKKGPYKRLFIHKILKTGYLLNLNFRAISVSQTFLFPKSLSTPVAFVGPQSL